MAVPTKLDHCVIHVSDWERSNAFYRDVMGAELVQRPVGWAYRFGDKQLNVHGKGVSPAEVARLPVQPGNSDLCFEWAGPDRGRHRASEETQRRDPCRADAAVRRQGRGHQRLFPRSGRLADGIHVVSGALRHGRRVCTIQMCCRTICRCRRTTAPRGISQAFGFPTLRLLRPTARRSICRSSRAAPSSMSIRAPDVPGRRCRPAGTPSPARAAARRSPAASAIISPSCSSLALRRCTGFRPRTPPISARSAERLHLPFAILSDAELQLTRAMRLPTFTVDGMTLIKRMAWVIDDGVVTHVFYPVFPPDRSAAEVVGWLKQQRSARLGPAASTSRRWGRSSTGAGARSSHSRPNTAGNTGGSTDDIRSYRSRPGNTAGSTGDSTAGNRVGSTAR